MTAWLQRIFLSVSGAFLLLTAPMVTNTAFGNVHPCTEPIFAYDDGGVRVASCNALTGSETLGPTSSFFGPLAGFVAAKSGQQVFRVVNDAEKVAIQNSGKFEFLPIGSTPTGEAGKFFWKSMDEAKQFQPYWYRGGENSHIVSTTLGSDATPTLFPHTDGIGTAIWAPMKDITAPIVFH